MPYEEATCPPPQNEIVKEAKKRHYITAGFCPGNYGYMMKKVLATPIDTVSFNSDGIYVNQERLALSKPILTDGLGRAMPIYQGKDVVINDSQLLVMSDVSSVSFDSRYLGPIHQKQIINVIQPVFTW